MSRKLRIQFKGAGYHITSRGTLKQNIFPKDNDKAYFLRLLRNGAKRYRIDVFSYCIMNNHYHLAIRISTTNLREFMHYLGSSYANYLVRAGWVGHVFAGRYKSICINEEEYFLIVNRYIHLNPVEAGIVSRPEDYAWSNYRNCISRGGEDWLEENWLEEYFGPGLAAARRRYRQFVEEAMGLGAFYPENEVVAQALLGSEEFIKRIKTSIHGKTWKNGVVGRKELARVLSLREIHDAVCGCLGLTGLEQGDYRGDEDYRRACFLFIDMAKEYAVASNGDIARLLGGISENAVSHRFVRMRERVCSDNAMQARLDADRKRILEVILSTSESGGGGRV